MKTQLIVALVLSLSAISAQAFNPIEHVAQTVLKKAQNNNKVAQDNGGGLFEPKSCTNFSGSWVGKCVVSSPDGDKVQPGTQIIKQGGCSTIELQDSGDKQIISIGGVRNESFNMTFITGDFRRVYDWNKEATEIFMRFDFFMKMTTPQGGRMDMNISGRMYLENNQLKMDANGPDLKVSCSYDRQ